MRLVLLCLLVASLSLVRAEDSVSLPEENAPAETPTAQAEVKKKKPEAETPDSFEATEQLSEDVPAPFPVDI